MLYNNIAKHKRILTHTDMLFSSLNKTLSILSKRNFKNLCILLKTDTHDVEKFLNCELKKMSITIPVYMLIGSI